MATRVGYGCLWLQELGMTTMVGYEYGLGVATRVGCGYKGWV
jgi:hypothetical protein